MKKYAYMGALRLSLYFKKKANKDFFNKYSRLLNANIDEAFVYKMEESYEFQSDTYTDIEKRIFSLLENNPIALTCFELAVLHYMDSTAAEIMNFVGPCHQNGITVELGARVYYLDDEIIYHVEEMKQASWILDLILDTVGTEDDILLKRYKCDTFLAEYLCTNSFDLNEKTMFLYNYENNVFPSVLYEDKIEIITNKVKGYNDSKGKMPLVHIKGAAYSGKKFIAQRMSAYLEKNLIFFDMENLIYDNAEEYIRKLLRYAYLSDTGICLYNINSSNYKELRLQLISLTDYIKEYGILMIVLSDESINLFNETDLTIYPFTIEEMTRTERYKVWLEFSEIFFPRKPIACNVLSMRIKANIGIIYRVFKYIVDNYDMDSTEEDFMKAYRIVNSNYNLKQYQVKRATEYTLDDLFISKSAKEILKNVCNQVIYKRKVFDEYGYEKKYPYGACVSVLFIGPSGTGKTMAATVVANMLGMELYQVDMSQIVDKYIGETEKKLKEVFDIASQNNMILFLDECDALIGKRSETKEAKDKYANVEVAYILQKIEEFDGVVIMASNFKNNIDTALMRRIKYEIKFEIPSKEIRKQMWQSVFDTNLPKDVIDYNYLAEQFEFTGASIKNIALNAIFKAVAEDVPIGMKHILVEIKNENTKNGEMFFADKYGAYGLLLVE